jgi:hypothetical protein
MPVNLRRATSPSIVLLRRLTELSSEPHGQLLFANLPTVSQDNVAIVSLAPDHLRIRDMPLG